MRVFFIILVFSYGVLNAQKEISTQQHGWVMYFGNHRLTDKWGIHSEYQWRRSDYFDRWQQSLLRLGVDYYGKNNEQYTLGYGWIRSYQYGEQPITHNLNEHRIWEQFLTKSKIGRFDIQHRYRLEQRFIENWAKDASGIYNLEGYVFSNRVRYRFFVSVPLTRKEMLDKTLFLAAYDEPFLGFGKGIQKNILDQNRLYFALGWRFNKQLNMQLGYLNQYIVKTDGIKAERNHTLQIGVTYNLDFRGQNP